MKATSGVEGKPERRGIALEACRATSVLRVGVGSKWKDSLYQSSNCPLSLRHLHSSIPVHTGLATTWDCGTSFVYQERAAEREVKPGARPMSPMPQAKVTFQCHVSQDQLQTFGLVSQPSRYPGARLMPPMFQAKLARWCHVPRNQFQIFGSVPQPCQRVP